MKPDGEDGPCASTERVAAAASATQRARYRAAYAELSLINEELVAEVARLAARIDERLSPRRYG
jgi:hypothetical protein